MPDSTAIEPFDFNGAPVHIVIVEGEPWFDAVEVCSILGLRVRDVMAALDRDEKLRDSVAGTDILDLISEPGLYSTVSRSRKPEAKAFQRWVNHEVLPSIRKTGSYTATPVDEIDLIIQQAIQLKAHRAELARLADQANRHEIALAELTSRTEYLEITYERVAALGYAKIKGLPTDVTWQNRLGRIASRIAGREGVPQEKVHSTIFGAVNAWPESVWDKALAELTPNV